ncbi:hypothetical protein [Peribacillus frigoritolerans]|uniref:Uncharacterized protein n=1 Tax=Peribacillus castrilensis TaxID=2897690 RepID=A0AAW9NPD5_9BACI|nr:hypothetical protein [Peribacillus castrilensis]
MGLPDMDRQPLSPRSKLCKCEPRCSNYIDIEYIGRYCDNQAMNFAVQLINLVKETNIVHGVYTPNWTTAQESVLKKWVENGVKNGDYRILGEMFGKNRTAVKNKVYDMEKEGKLKRPARS